MALKLGSRDPCPRFSGGRPRGSRHDPRPADQPTLQAGLDAAAVGDTVIAAPGIYAGPGNRNLDFGGKDLVLRSEAGAATTTLDCEEARRAIRFHGGETSAAVVEGNIEATPLFCDATTGDFRIAEASPCAPGQSGACGLVGAGDAVVCTPTRSSPPPGA